ncbi:ATP-binding protein [Streptomyces sp. NPDC004647]|uniref:ATP-binding protein n=1 Tax=Streptomyces sp. NPDC004647 TaxID=3154671 RepID=UPI0033AE0024
MIWTDTSSAVSAETPHVAPREAALILNPADRCQIETLPKAARNLVEEHLTRWNLASLIDDAKVVASELVTNAVQYAPCTAVGFALRYAEGALRIEVEDDSSEDPMLRQANGYEEHGRGLQLVGHLSHRWGFHRNGSGTKTTWCLFDTSSAVGSNQD